MKKKVQTGKSVLNKLGNSVAFSESIILSPLKRLPREGFLEKVFPQRGIYNNNISSKINDIIYSNVPKNYMSKL